MLKSILKRIQGENKYKVWLQANLHCTNKHRSMPTVNGLQHIAKTNEVSIAVCWCGVNWPLDILLSWGIRDNFMDKNSIADIWKVWIVPF